MPREPKSLLPLALLLLPIGAASATEPPVAVSPGNATQLVGVTQTCPTFSWAHVAEAQAYDLVVYELPFPEEAQPDDTANLQEPVLSRELPGGATSWTPSSPFCLDPGGTFGWSLRAHLRDGATTPWAQPLLLTVAPQPLGLDSRSAEGVLMRYLEAGGSLQALAEAAAPLELRPPSTSTSPLPAVPSMDSIVIGGDYHFSAPRAFRFWVPGAAFLQSDAETQPTYRRSSHGYGFADSTDNIGLRAPAHLPQGAVVTDFTCYYFDTDSTGNIGETPAALRRRATTSISATDMATVVFGPALLDEDNIQVATTNSISDATVDNTAFAYTINVDYVSSVLSPGQTRFYGCAVDYTLDRLNP